MTEIKTSNVVDRIVAFFASIKLYTISLIFHLIDFCRYKEKLHAECQGIKLIQTSWIVFSIMEEVKNTTQWPII